MVWEYNPKYRSVLSDLKGSIIFDNNEQWKNDELLKYHIIKISDLKNPKHRLTSLAVTTISIEPGSESVSIAIH